MDVSVREKVVVITGASRGIGKELAKAFSYENAKVVLCYFKSEIEADELYMELLISNPNCIKVKVDVTNLNDVIQLRDKTISTFGKIDVLINNAGICDDNSIQEMSVEQWGRVINVNLTGTYLCCKVFSENMIENKMGKIINISSLKGQEGSHGQANYSTSKAGLIGFSKALAKELCMHNISVNTVCPGFIRTTLNAHRFDKIEYAKERSLMSTNMNLQDLCNFLMYISSDKIQSVTGQVFNIDSRI